MQFFAVSEIPQYVGIYGNGAAAKRNDVGGDTLLLLTSTILCMGAEGGFHPGVAS